MSNLAIGFAAIVLVLFLAWDMVSFLILPVIVCSAALLISFIFGRFEMTLDKFRNVAVVVVATLFLVLSIYFSLSFPVEMADGEHFRSIVPFLNVSFR